MGCANKWTDSCIQTKRSRISDFNTPPSPRTHTHTKQKLDHEFLTNTKNVISVSLAHSLQHPPLTFPQLNPPFPPHNAQKLDHEFLTNTKNVILCRHPAEVCHALRAKCTN